MDLYLASSWFVNNSLELINTRLPTLFTFYILPDIKAILGYYEEQLILQTLFYHIKYMYISLSFEEVLSQTL